MVIVDDLGPSAWIPSAIRPFASGVGALVPPVFEEYARVLHPAYVYDLEGERRPVRWEVIADAKGRVLHPLVQFPHLVGTLDFENGPSAADRWRDPPAQGTIPPELTISLGAVLAEHTSTPGDCWFAVWDGFADSLVRDRTRARVRMPGRDFVLLEGPVSAISTSLAEFGLQSANLWWPEDHAWCVATDVDLVSTYVGGTSDAIAAVVAKPDLEALRVGVDDPIDYSADRLNPAPEGLRPRTRSDG